MIKPPQEPREPHLDLDPEASANLVELLGQPHHPSAAEANLRTAKANLRRRLSRRYNLLTLLSVVASGTIMVMAIRHSGIGEICMALALWGVIAFPLYARTLSNQS